MYWHPSRSPIQAGPVFCKDGPLVGPLSSVSEHDGLVRLAFTDEAVARVWAHRLGQDATTMQGKVLIIAAHFVRKTFTYRNVRMIRRQVDALTHNQQLDPAIYRLVTGE